MGHLNDYDSQTIPEKYIISGKMRLVLVKWLRKIIPTLKMASYFKRIILSRIVKITYHHMLLIYKYDVMNDMPFPCAALSYLKKSKKLK